MFIEAIITAIIVSIDGFFSGFAVGIKKTKILLRNNDNIGLAKWLKELSINEEEILVIIDKTKVALEIGQLHFFTLLIYKHQPI